MRKSQVQIAGAGAGKTYGLAELICNSEIEYGKNIYAITYTNYAKRNIEEKVLEQKGYIPDNIKISTIHTFLLNEIIYPYSSYILNKKINKASSVSLPDDKKRRNSKMSQLEKQGIVHNEKVFNIAKQIIVGNKQQTKKEKYRRSLIINHFIASIDSIYIDEAQDLDNDIVEIIKLIAINNIYIYMVGDPKQALRNTKVFLDFVDEVKSEKIENMKILPNNNTTRRLPKEIVKITNLYCIDNQQQDSISDIKGNISYIYVEDDNFEKIFDDIKDKNGLIYTRKKEGEFNTKKERNIMTSELKRILLEKREEKDDEDAFLYEKEKELEDILNSNKHLKSSFLDKYGIRLPKDEFYNLLNQNDTITKYKVESIDKVKGLENKNCMFIVNDSMLKYLLKKNTERNKELNYLYVALTRTKCNLILGIYTKEDKKVIDRQLQELGIYKYKELIDNE